MKKILKIILLIILGIILLWFILVMADGKRLENNNGSKPIITIKTIDKDYNITYYGIGYSVRYDYIQNSNSKDIVMKKIISSEFKIFNFRLWTWVS